MADKHMTIQVQVSLQDYERLDTAQTTLKVQIENWIKDRAKAPRAELCSYCNEPAMAVDALDFTHRACTAHGLQLRIPVLTAALRVSPVRIR